MIVNNSIKIKPKIHISILWTKLLYYTNQNSGWGNSKGVAWHLKYWRKFLVFAKSLTCHRAMSDLLDFYTENKIINSIVSKHTCILEQVIRNWCFYKSKMTERIDIQKYHFNFLQNKLSIQTLEKMYLEQGIELWSNQYKEETLKAIVHFERIHRKEGLLTVTLKYGERRLYLSTFWIAPGLDGKPAIWVGSLQGSQGELNIIRDLTKHFFGYRTKNLMLYTVRGAARELGIDNIYAVSNYGFQASRHLYTDRRLKTSLDELWEETGGKVCTDKRFYKLPLVEYRKDIEEIATKKRNLYRKRFALLDEVDIQISDALQSCLKQGE